ncbi:F0F1 ATP synthase subunit A [Alienimonas chondri]|uniref:ATP synthase subunit a n=1 Tax=Alienimonas chondri TaxID=2681879 RepID=A0ABX1VHT2_9PLAN|nr:F0F1 ATP synthase subunit A [Alienimonas chondri]NNJ26828.1 ATP synthase subunit a [Alienimonas chondri]
MAAEDHSDDPFHHVRDANAFHLPGNGEYDIHLPKVDWLPSLQSWLDGGPVMGLQLTKFMVLQVVAAALALLIFAPLAAKLRNGDPVRGRFWNFWETILVFIRDEVVRPTIGDHDAHPHAGDANDHSTNQGHHAEGHYNADHDPLKEANFDLDSAGTSITPGPTAGHPADKYLPLIWSWFIYILFCNLMGALPWMGTPSGNINVTGFLAITVFVTVVGVGIHASGFIGYLKSLVPGMELPSAIKPILLPVIWLIEAMGLFIKHTVLAVRLFANLMAGHVALALLLSFTGAGWAMLDDGTAGLFLGTGITIGSVLGQVFVGLLELFVAFMQAYVFTFLATLFIAGAVHPH